MDPLLRLQLEKTARDAVALYGHTSQMNIFQEECAELIVAVSHLRRKRVGVEAVIEEIADVIIMAEQARSIAPEKVDAALRRKLDRLVERMANE